MFAHARSVTACGLSASGDTVRRMKIPVGVATVVGLLTGVLQIAGAIVLYVNGEHAAATALIATGNAQTLLVGAGRYLQAHAQIGVVATQLVPAVAAELAPAEDPPVERPETAVVPDGAQQAPPPAAPAPAV